MADEQGAVPSRHEIETQLQRMLDEDVFRSHPKQAEVFACIVVDQLNKKEVTEKSIRAEVFPNPPYDPLGNHVRVTITHVRDRIAEYYVGPGNDDPVIIGLPSRKKRKLPPGESYRLTFAYNRRSVANEQVRRGLHHIAELDSRPYLDFALRAFAEAIEAEPAYGPAHAAMAEAQLLKAFFTDDIPPEEFLGAAEASAREALRCNENLWQAHIILGVVHDCRWNREEAKAAFDAAMVSREACNSPWRAAHILADSVMSVAGNSPTNHAPALTIDEVFSPGPPNSMARVLMPSANVALEIMERYAKNRPGDGFAHSLYGLFLHAAEHNDIRVASAGAEENSDRHNWLMHVVHEMEGIALSGMRRDGILEWGEPPYYMPYDITYMAILEDDRFLTPCCPGLAVLFAASRGFGKQAREMLDRLESTGPYVRAIQLALGYMGVGDHERALKELARAGDEHDPFLVWLALWPVFKPLRDYPEFKALINRMYP